MAIRNITVNVSDNDQGMRALFERLESQDPTHVDTGILADEASELIVIAAAHEFGATINHPGGTDYGYKTADDAKSGKVRFLKKGEGHTVLGTTGPHVINLPQRSYMRSTVDEKGAEIQEFALKQARLIRDGAIDKEIALNKIGLFVVSKIKEKIVDLKDPPNKPATIKRKGSSNPLVDTGRLTDSISHRLGNKND